MTPRSLFLILALALSGAPAVAAPVWREADALAAFRAESPRLAAARRLAEAARAERAGAGLWPNPSIDVGREQVFTPGGPTEQNRFGVQATLPVPGKLELQRAIADAGVEAAEARAEAEIFALEAEFLATYARAHRAEARAIALELALGAYRRLEGVVAARHRAGETAGYDLMRVRLDRAAAESRWRSARAEAAAERAHLAGDLGRPPEGALSLAPARPVPEAPGILASALARRADLRARRAEARQAELALALAERLRWPDPALALGVKQTNEPTVRGLGYATGLVWPVPVFDHGQGERARARAAMATAEAEARAIAARLAAELPAARALLVERLEAAARFERDVLEAAPRLVAVAEVAYREGAQGMPALLEAHEASIAARLQHLDMQAEAHMARLDLERLAGGPLEDTRSTP